MKKYLIIIFLPLCVFAQPLDEDVSYLSSYILSLEFDSIKTNYGDLAAVDSIYTQALEYQNGDISEALLSTAFASLAFYQLPINVPIIQLKLDLPLACVSQELFEKKVNALPGKLFFNSPQNLAGDRDKIAHFFGSAYFANTVTIFKLSKFMGIFVEFFEAAFKVEGSLDLRDISVNNLGELYGKALRDNPNLLPSEALKLYNLFYFKITN